MRSELQAANHRVSGLVDVLDRVLDKGLAIAGDIKISLAEVELLTIRIRLIVCSIDKAQEIGLDWWKYDPHFAPGRPGAVSESADLRRQLAALEAKVAVLSQNGRHPAPRRPRGPRKPK
jgi:gas vesicle protein GvpA/GvpJ/GvpM family